MSRSITILITSIGITAICITMYYRYVASMTKNYVIEIKDYRIELSIKMIETFLDSQDDYSFFFSHKNHPDRKVKLEIDDCLSRCWVLSRNKQYPKLVLLHGCDMNSQLIYIIDLNNYSYKELSSMPKEYIMIDTLTNLYVDEQLPPNYKY